MKDVTLLMVGLAVGVVGKGKIGGEIGGGGAVVVAAGGGLGGGYSCHPNVRYVTHIVTKFNDVPVVEKVVKPELVVEPHDEVVFSTIYEVRNVVITQTNTITTTETVKQVEREEVTETATQVVYVPEYSSVTQDLTQEKKQQFTSYLYTTQTSAYAFPSTTVVTVDETVTEPLTRLHKSGTLAANEVVLTGTVQEIYAVNHAQYGYGYGRQGGVVTENVMEFRPSLVTSTLHQTHYSTTTTYQQVPIYVTKTLVAKCGHYR